MQEFGLERKHHPCSYRDRAKTFQIRGAEQSSDTSSYAQRKEKLVVREWAMQGRKQEVSFNRSGELRHEYFSKAAEIIDVFQRV